MVRALPVAAVLAMLAGAAQAQPAASAPVASEAAADQRLLELNQQLQAAQNEIQRLRAANAELDAQRSAVAVCEAKNDRLVGIGNELIAAFQAKYRRSQFEPFQLGRRHFEAELQAQGDAIYQNRTDAVAPPPPPPAADTPGPAPAATPGQN